MWYCLCFLRTFTGYQNPEEQCSDEQFFNELIFRFFRENKVDISSVITQPFPFLMGLRDRSFIPEQMYEVSDGNSLFSTSCALHSARLQDAMSRVKGLLWMGPSPSCKLGGHRRSRIPDSLPSSAVNEGGAWHWGCGSVGNARGT